MVAMAPFGLNCSHSIIRSRALALGSGDQQIVSVPSANIQDLLVRGRGAQKTLDITAILNEDVVMHAV